MTAWVARANTLEATDVTFPEALVPLAALARPGMKASALRAAAERGRLRAARGPDGQWRSSRRWVDDYVASRYRRIR